MKGPLVTVLCLACGSRAELDVVSTSAATATTCAWTTKFESVTPLSIEPTAGTGDLQLRLSIDELTGYFKRDGDIYVTHRSALDAPFDTPSLVAEVSWSSAPTGSRRSSRRTARARWATSS